MLKYESDVVLRDDDFCSEFFGGFLEPLFKLPENAFGTADQMSLSQYRMKKKIKEHSGGDDGNCSRF